MKNFTGKVAAITGAASGIGRALALELANRGCDLALSDIDEVGLAETAKLISQAKPRIKTTTAKIDTANRDAMHQWAEKVVTDHGKVNLIFNNAGVALAGTVEETSYEDYEWIIGINMWGVVQGTKAFLPLLKESGDGHIINISSIFGLFSQPSQSGYNMAKFAVRGFTESLRQELDIENCGVSASCVHPGGIQTNIVKNARMNKSVEKMYGGVSNEKLRADFEAQFSTTPKKAAQVILKGVRANKRRILIGNDAKVIDIMQRSLPAAYQKIVTSQFLRSAK